MQVLFALLCEKCQKRIILTGLLKYGLSHEKLFDVIFLTFFTKPLDKRRKMVYNTFVILRQQVPVKAYGLSCRGEQI